MNSQCSEDTVYKTTQNCTESRLTSRFAWCKNFCNFFAKKSPAPATPPVHAPLEPVRDIEIFAYIRFADEAITFRACLNSLLPTITKGVLVYHLLPPDASAATRQGQARSLQIAQEFCAQNPGFSLICYEHVVYPQSHDRYFRDRVRQQRAARNLPPLEGFTQELPAEQTLQALYEFTRDQILARASTPYPYILKVDGDHIYDAQVLQHQLDFLARAPELVRFLGLPKFNVYYSRTRDQLFFRSVVAVDDHFIVLAHLLQFKSYCEDKYDLNGQIIKPQALAYEMIIAHILHYNPSIPWYKFRSKNKNNLTYKYLLSLLPQQGAILQHILSKLKRNIPNQFYMFTSQQVQYAYNPQQWHLLRKPCANGFPESVQKRQLAAYSVGEVLTPNLESLYRQINRERIKQQKNSLQSKPLQDSANPPGSCLESHTTVPWYNSAHFLLQKHVLRQYPHTGDLSDAELIEHGLVPFARFKDSALFKELEIRFPHFDATSLVHNEERLLAIARKFDYSELE